MVAVVVVVVVAVVVAVAVVVVVVVVVIIVAVYICDCCFSLVNVTIAVYTCCCRLMISMLLLLLLLLLSFQQLDQEDLRIFLGNFAVFDLDKSKTGKNFFCPGIQDSQPCLSIRNSTKYSSLVRSMSMACKHFLRIFNEF